MVVVNWAEVETEEKIHSESIQEGVLIYPMPPDVSDIGNKQ